MGKSNDVTGVVYRRSGKPSYLSGSVLPSSFRAPGNAVEGRTPVFILAASPSARIRVPGCVRKARTAARFTSGSLCRHLNRGGGRKTAPLPCRLTLSPRCCLPHRASEVPSPATDVPLFSSAVVSKWCQKPPTRTPHYVPILRIWLTYGKSERVTDGARTRDLRSHNPMLYLLSYGHQARKRFYQEWAATGWGL
jgi:hypothetical protein